MKKGYLFLTSLLVTLIGLLMPSCRATKTVPAQTDSPNPGLSDKTDTVQTAPTPPDRIRVLYGVPPQVYQRLHSSDTQTTDTNDFTPNDSARTAEAAQAQ